MPRTLAVCLLVFSACAILPPRARAQARLTGADLEGTVVDQSGGVMPGTAITVTNTETNVSRTVETDMDGRYAAPALAPGTYTITVSRPGFRTQKRDDVNLFLGESVTIDFMLAVAPTAETVNVTAEVPPVQISRTELSSLVSQQQIESLPINGRNFISFSVITPGVST